MKRREFMKAAGTGAAGLALSGASAAQSASGRRPNIVLIMADDMGFSDIGCFGSEIQTPNIDRLSRQGLNFTQFYNCARCCPTRASLLTGLYPHQAGVGHMTHDHNKPGYRGHINHSSVTIAEALGPAGYHTLMAGKWHVGAKPGMWPADRGFDRHFGILAGSCNFFRPNPRGKLVLDREKAETGEGFYTTDAFTDYALEFMRDCRGRDDKPFFLYLSHNAPHWPLHAWPEDIAKYEGRYLSGWDELREERHERMKKLGVVDPAWRLSPRDRGTPPWKAVPGPLKQRMALKMAVYAAMVDSMDQNIGRVIAQLEEMGELDNTLIMFLSDNGACHEYWAYGFDFLPGESPLRPGPIGSADSFTSYGRGWSNAGNTPFRLHKHWAHEGGIATPLIAHWPAVIKEGGKLTHEPGHVIDLMTTCLDMAGAEYPQEHAGRRITPLEGKSLSPVFETGSREPHQAIYWEHEGNRAVRQGDWKIVSDYPGGWQLYNLAEDRTELNNLARKNPAKLKELAALYKGWADRVGVLPWNPAWAVLT